MNDLTPADRPAPASPASPTAPAPASPASPAAEEPGRAEERAADGTTAIYVRRSRRPSLLFWVLLALLVPTLLGFLIAPLLGIADLGSMLNLGLLAGLFVGVPLAAAAAAVDAVRHRRRRRPR